MHDIPRKIPTRTVNRLCPIACNSDCHRVRSLPTGFHCPAFVRALAGGDISVKTAQLSEHANMEHITT